MPAELSEWLNLALRWFHVVAGAYWIGQTAFFAWLDARMQAEAEPGAAEDSIWMVHSGGFYRVARRPPGEPPARTLHWFKWEAALTWLSGFGLLVLVYYMGGALLDADAPIAKGWAIALGVGVLLVGWKVYDLVWTSPLAGRPRLAIALSLALLFATGWGLTQVFSGRAAYLHVGGLLGTIMFANVWERILPGQRKLVEAARAGRAPDARLAAIAKQRSHHNTYLAVPVLFLMVSHHFPTTAYGGSWPALRIALFVLAGLAARRLLERSNRAG